MAAARVVLLVGEPGTGKTTLGRLLSEELRLPFLARDQVRRGMLLTAGVRPEDDVAVDAFLAVVEAMTALGISCVVEYVVRASRPDALDRIAAAGDCVVVQTWCDDARARRDARDRADRILRGRDDLDAAVAVAEAKMQRIAEEMQTEFDLPTLRVETNDGYDPPLDAIIEFATRR